MDLKDLKITTDSKCSELNWVLNEKNGEPNFSGEIFRILVEKHNALIEALEKGSIEAKAALPLRNVNVSFSKDEIIKAYQAGCVETLTGGEAKTVSFTDMDDIKGDAIAWVERLLNSR